jgi:hypothetical protein
MKRKDLDRLLEISWDLFHMSIEHSHKVFFEENIEETKQIITDTGIELRKIHNEMIAILTDYEVIKDLRKSIRDRNYTP